MCMCIYLYSWYFVSMTFFSSYIFSNNCIMKKTGNTFSAPGESLSLSEVIIERLKTYFAFHLWLTFIELS